MGSFGDDLRKIAEKTKERANFIVSKIVTDISTELVEKSPVGDGKYWQSAPPPGYVGGRFRGNWNLGVGEADGSTTEAIDAGGAVTIAKIVGKMPADASGKVFFITNSLPYAIALEEGHSPRQAPNGMVAITVLEFEPIVRAAAESIK